MISANILTLVILAVGQDVPPRFTVESAAASQPGCRLVALGEDGVWHLENAAGRHRIDRFIEIRQDDRPLPPLLESNFVSLTNGDRLVFDSERAPALKDTRLTIWPGRPLGNEPARPIDLFLPNAVLLFWSLPDGVEDAARFFADLQRESRQRDVIFLKTGDRIEGTLTALDGQAGCALTAGKRSVKTPLAKVAGIVFNTDRQARLRTKKPYMRAVLAGGSRVNFLELRFDEKSRRWAGKTQFGATLELPEASVLGLDVRQDLAVELTDLDPMRYESRPFLGITWPLMTDLAATGQPLRLAGSTYEKGLGTHAACRVTYKLDGKYQRFDAIVGIDESARRGRAKVAVDLDGKRFELNEGKELTHQTAPVQVRLDVSNARVMTLIVEFGSFGDVQAHVNWAKARLIKK